MGCDMVVLCPIHEGTLSEVRGEGTLPGVEWEMRTQTAVIRAITEKREKREKRKVKEREQWHDPCPGEDANNNSIRPTRLNPSCPAFPHPMKPGGWPPGSPRKKQPTHLTKPNGLSASSEPLL